MFSLLLNHNFQAINSICLIRSQLNTINYRHGIWEQAVAFSDVRGSTKVKATQRVVNSARSNQGDEYLPRIRSAFRQIVLQTQICLT